MEEMEQQENKMGRKNEWSEEKHEGDHKRDKQRKRERKHKRLLGHWLHGLFILQDMFCYMLSTHAH